jgi:transcriptional regulator with XRE-family HTH domain
MARAFSDFLRDKRLKTKMSLRQFAKEVGLQPSNYCNVEAGSLPPPTAETLERIARKLGLRPGDEEHHLFHDLAAKARDEIPADVERIVRESDVIPALLRTVEGEKLTDAQLRGIIEDLKSGRYKRP